MHRLYRSWWKLYSSNRTALYIASRKTDGFCGQQSVSCQRILYMLFIPPAMPQRTPLNKRIHRHVIFILVSPGHGARDYSFCSRYAYTISNHAGLTLQAMHCHIIERLLSGLIVASCRINSSRNSKNVIYSFHSFVFRRIPKSPFVCRFLKHCAVAFAWKFAFCLRNLASFSLSIVWKWCYRMPFRRYVTQRVYYVWALWGNRGHHAKIFGRTKVVIS